MKFQKYEDAQNREFFMTASYYHSCCHCKKTTV